MSLLIEKMIMPEQGAYEARLVVFKEGKASLSIVTGNVITTYDVSELPPHGDLIDRSELLNQYKPDPEEEHLMKTENPIAYQLMDKIADKVTESINSVKAIIEAEE